MAWDVTTEWDDIHRKLGNFPELPKKETLEEMTNAAIDKAEQENPLEGRDLEDLEDELEDDILAKYREKRLQEMREAALKPRFGQLIEIRRDDYVQEINEAPAEVFVVLHLYQDYLPLCKKLNMVLEQLARKFIYLKFIKIKATQCNENFLDADCPTILVYKGGSIQKQLSQCAAIFGGSQMTPDTVEWVLANLSILETELEENPLNKPTSIIRHPRREDLSDSDDDREYMSNQLPRYR